MAHPAAEVESGNSVSLRPKLASLLSPALLLAQSTSSHIGRVTVDSVDVTSDSDVSSQHLLRITQEIEDHTYPPGQDEEIVERARCRLQREGYFKADVSLNDVQTLNQGDGTIAVTLAIREGRQYRLGPFRFTGNKELSESNLTQQIPIADGDIFDTEQIRKGLEQIRKLYVSHGYINFSPVANPEPDEDRDVISLKIDCDEGKTVSVRQTGCSPDKNCILVMARRSSRLGNYTRAESTTETRWNSFVAKCLGVYLQVGNLNSIWRFARTRKPLAQAFASSSPGQTRNKTQSAEYFSPIIGPPLP